MWKEYVAKTAEAMKCVRKLCTVRIDTEVKEIQSYNVGMNRLKKQ
jgi:hypothetical protein